MKRKAWRSMILVLLIICLLGGCQRQAEVITHLFDKPENAEGEEPSLYIYLTHSEKEDSFTHLAAELFAGELQERSKGKMAVKIFPDNTLGTVTEADEMLKNGTVQMRIGSGPSRAIIALGCPAFTGMGMEELKVALKDEEVKEFLDEECLEQGARIVGMLPPLYRVLVSSKNIQAIEDFQEFRLRSSGFSLSEQYWSCFGVENIAITLPEVYLAMQQGRVDGNGESTLLGVISNKFYEQQKYLLETKHMIYLEPVYMSEKFWSSITSEQQSIIEEALAVMEEKSQKELDRLLEEGKALLAENGVVWIDWGENSREMEEMARETMYETIRGFIGEELADGLLMVLRNK